MEPPSGQRSLLIGRTRYGLIDAQGAPIPSMRHRLPASSFRAVFSTKKNFCSSRLPCLSSQGTGRLPAQALY
jgi:hypothetical protein